MKHLIKWRAYLVSFFHLHFFFLSIPGPILLFILFISFSFLLLFPFLSSSSSDPCPLYFFSNLLFLIHLHPSSVNVYLLLIISSSSSLDILFSFLSVTCFHLFFACFLDEPSQRMGLLLYTCTFLMYHSLPFFWPPLLNLASLLFASLLDHALLIYCCDYSLTFVDSKRLSFSCPLT